MLFEPVDLIATVFKAAGLVCLLQAVGMALFAVLYRPQCGAALSRIRAAGTWTVVVAAILTLAAQSLDAGRMAGELAGVFDTSLQALNWSSDAASASLLRVFGCVLIAVGLRTGYSLTLPGALLVVASFSMTGHTTASEYRWLLVGLLSLHVAIAAYWLGALSALTIVVKRESSIAAIEAFSSHATRTIPLLGMAGIAMAVLLLPSVGALVTPYGLGIVGKAGGFTVLVALAALNKLRWLPAMQAGNAEARSAFARTVQAEYIVAVAVLTITASLATLLAPE